MEFNLEGHLASMLFAHVQAEALPVVQGLPEANSGCNQLVRTRHGHRASEHRVQLRHARGQRHVPPPRECLSYFFDRVSAPLAILPN